MPAHGCAERNEWRGLKELPFPLYSQRRCLVEYFRVPSAESEALNFQAKFCLGEKCSYHFQNTEGFVVSKRDSQNKNSLKALAFVQGTKAGSWLSWEASVSLLHTPWLPVLHNRFQKGFLKSQVWQTRAHKQVRVLLSVLSLCSSPQISPGQSKTYGFYHSLSSSTGLPYLANANLKVSKTELRNSFKPSSSNFSKLWEMTVFTSLSTKNWRQGILNTWK